ncbi:MAG: ABC transporter permease, partial [Nitrosomonadaceae bacterium]|nr:ABC transporter permease [Nitrosomonadaceae bacterium]
MPFKPVILWTDALIYLLLVLVIIFAWHIRRNEHLLVPWRRVGQSASGMMALIVLALFVSIGLLDTVHFRPAIENNSSTNIEKIYGVQVLSLFDVIATPLRKNVEKTYSAPFATHLYTRETIELSEGRQVREFPRLKFGGAHLDNPEIQFTTDVTWRAVVGVGFGLFVWCVLVASLVILLAYQSGKKFIQTLFAIL